MSVASDYIIGTITLTNGSTSFSGVGTSWLAADFREGDLIIWIDGGEDFSSPIIQQILTNTSGTLTSAWAGPTLTNVSYRMRYQWDSSRVSAQSRQLIEQLGNGNITSFSGLEGPGVPVFNGPHSLVIKPEQDFINGIAYNVQVDELSDRDAYDGQIEGFSVLVSDNGDGRAALYSKASNTSGDWTEPAYITGPIGAQSIIEATVTSLPTGSEPDVNVTPITGGYNLAFELPEAEGFYWASVYNSSETYPLSSVVRYNRSSFIAIQNVPINESPSNAFPPVDNSFWEVLAQGGVNGIGTIAEIENGIGISIDESDPTTPIISLDAALGDLKDVDLTTNPPEDGQAIVWNETEEMWVPGGATGNAPLRGYLSGGTLSNSAALPATQINVSDGVATSDDNLAFMTFGAGVVDCTVVGVNGLDTGTLSASTWYHVFVISGDTTGLLASVSATAPSLPSGYTKKRRIGSFKTDAASQIISFKQIGNLFLWDVPVNTLGITDPGTTAFTIPLEVPSGVVVEGRFIASINNANASPTYGYFSPLSVPDASPNTQINQGGRLGSAAGMFQVNGIQLDLMTNTSRQVRGRFNASYSNLSLQVNTLGWRDYL